MEVLNDLDEQLSAAGAQPAGEANLDAAIDRIPPHRHLLTDLGSNARESDAEWRERQKRWLRDVYQIWLPEGEALARQWQQKYIRALVYDAGHGTEFASAVYWCYAPSSMRKYEAAIADARTSKSERDVAEYMLAQQAERRAIVERFERLHQAA
jgi:hypothetical protein